MGWRCTDIVCDGSLISSADACMRVHARTIEQLRRSSTGAAADTARRRRRTFVLGADQIRWLKRRISQQLSKPASAYVAVSSLAWPCIVGAKMSSKMILPDDEAYLIVNADWRGRLRDPPIDEGFFGNCVTGCNARARAGDLLPPHYSLHLVEDDVGGLARAAVAIQEAIREGVEAPAGNPFSDFWERLEHLLALPPGRASTTVGSSHRFMAYETDFGWGAPGRVELVSIFGGREMVALLGARDDGGVQVSVSLDGACIWMPSPTTSSASHKEGQGTKLASSAD